MQTAENPIGHGKNWFTLTRGVLAILIGLYLGGLFSLTFINHLVVRPEQKVILIFQGLVTAYMIFVGINHLRRGRGKSEIGRSIGWGRILLGAFIICMSLKTAIAPDPSSLQPANVAQKQGMYFAYIVIGLGGAYLIYKGLRARFVKTIQKEE